LGVIISKDYDSITIENILAKLDIALSELRDAIKGAGDKDLSTLESDIESILAKLDVSLSTRLADSKIPSPIPQEDITNEPKISINKDNVGLAKESGNLASILGQLDIALSSLRDALLSGTASYPGGLDDIYNKLNTQLDITISALRDALKGTGSKDFTTLETELDKKPDEATTPNEYNVTLTNADTEYSQALPAGTKALEFWARESVDIRFAFTSGKVATPTAPYFTLKAGTTYYKESLNLSGKTLYLASSTAGTNVEIIAWT